MPKQSQNLQRGETFLRDTDRVLDFIGALESGLYMREACAIVGVGTATIYGALRQGKIDRRAEQDTPFAEFATNVERAMATAEQESLVRIRGAARVNPAFWAADAWWLERRYPEKYGRKDRIAMEHSGDVGFSVSAKIDLQEVNSDVARALLSHAATVASRTTGRAIDAGEDDESGDFDAEPSDSTE